MADMMKVKDAAALWGLTPRRVSELCKQGKIAKAMRTIVRAATPRSSKRYVVEIREKGGDSVHLGDETEAE